MDNNELILGPNYSASVESGYDANNVLYGMIEVSHFTENPGEITIKQNGKEIKLNSEAVAYLSEALLRVSKLD